MRDISIYIYYILHNLASWDLTWTNMGLSRDIYIMGISPTIGYHWDMTGCRLRLAISHGKIKWHDGTVGTSYVYGLKRELNQQ